MPNIVSIASLQGGQNDTDPPSSLADDMCVTAQNVEFFQSTLGERRAGCQAVSLTNSLLDTTQVIVFLGTHQPADKSVLSVELWGVSSTPERSVAIARQVGTVWQPVTPLDAINPSSQTVFQIRGQTLHFKYFLCYKCTSTVNRMHVWDGTALRRAGLAAPSDHPTAANTGSAGAFQENRIYRVRVIRQNADTTILLRSEPSEEVTFTPSGLNDGAVITFPAPPGESETHWEVEASTGDGNFYRIATVPIANTVYTDTNQPAVNYSQFTLSETIGDYTPPVAAKYVIFDQDRAIFASSFEDSTVSCRIWWTPVAAASGVGNDERIPIATNNYLDLDSMDGGAITGLSQPINGAFYAFKFNRIYKLQRTGNINSAYQAVVISLTRGALPGSIVNGVDEFGRPVIYFLDPAIGPCRVGVDGLRIMKNLLGTWRRVNTAAAQVVCHGIYYADKLQIHWWVAVDGADSPSLKIISQITNVVSDQNGTTRGWATANGRIAQAYCSTTVPEVAQLSNGNTRVTFRPYIGLTNPDYIQRCDVGTTDAGQAFTATILTKPLMPFSLITKWGVMALALLGKAVTTSSNIAVSLIVDFGKGPTVTVNTSFTPSGAETAITQLLDNLSISDAHTIQVQFTDQ